MIKRVQEIDNHSTIMEDVFQLKEFHPLQREPIGKTLAGKVCLYMIPTGGGKSLHIQLKLPSFLSAGVTLVVSPTHALITDQVAHCMQYGIPACNFYGDITTSDTETYQIYALNQSILATF